MIFLELVISPVTDLTNGFICCLVVVSAYDLSITGGVCETGSFFHGLLEMGAGFSYGYAITGLSSAGFLFHGNVAPPIAEEEVDGVAFTSSFFAAATTLDTTYPKGAIKIILFFAYLTLFCSYRISNFLFKDRFQIGYGLRRGCLNLFFLSFCCRIRGRADLLQSGKRIFSWFLFKHSLQIRHTACTYKT